MGICAVIVTSETIFRLVPLFIAAMRDALR
jgi:hypothetical protein